MADLESDVARLEESLRQCRRELAGVRQEQENWGERIAPLEQAARQLRALAEALDQHLTDAERATRGVKGWIRRRLVPGPTPAEVDDVARLRASPLFDGAWYLQEYPEVVRSGLSPALHYLRHGAAERKDPGPNFDARTYLRDHPDVPRDANPVLHFEASVPGVRQ